MKLSIISLKGIEFEGEVVSLNVKTSAGEVTVLDNHRPLLTSLVSGKAAIIKKDGEKINFNVTSGFLEVGKGNNVSILSN